MPESSDPPGRALGERAIWDYELVKVLTPRELRVRYRQSLLDIAWALISPVAILIVYGLVLTQSFDVTSACGPYLSNAWAGLVIWTFFSTALGTAAYSLISSADLVTKLYFPREALPLSMVGASLADLGIGLVTVFLVVLVQGVHLTWTTVYAVFPLVVVVIWTAAISVFVGVVAAFVRDVPHAVQLFLRVGFFITPVMYDESFLPPALAWSAAVNPVAAAITGFREAVLCGQRPDLVILGIHLLTGSAALFATVLYTRSVERRMTDVV